MPKRKLSADIDTKSEYVFTWRIKNYSFCYRKKGDHIASPQFNIENLSDGQWYLMLYPQGINKLKDDEKFLSCSLGWKPHNEVVKTPAITYSLEIANEAGGVLKCLEARSRVFSRKANIWGMMRFIKIDELTEKMNSWKEDILVLRCRIKCDKQRKQTISGSEACTTIEVDRRSFEWDIKIPMSLGYSESLVFPFSDSLSFEITLMESLTIRIQKKDHYFFTRPVQFKIAVHDERDNEISSKSDEHLFKLMEPWKFPNIITKNVLEACKVNSHSCHFKLKCEIYILRDYLSSTSSIDKLKYITFAPVDFIPEDSSILPLQTDFDSLYNDKKHCDITIRVKNNEFPVHKLVLRMRSPVFTAMFEQDMMEKDTGVVDITDVEVETIKHFLEFLYTGRVKKMDYESAKNLMLVADKYQVPSLVEECASFLKSDLSVENVLNVISIADSLNCESLKTYTIYFIKANVAKILITSSWTAWMKENIILASGILSKIYADF